MRNLFIPILMFLCTMSFAQDTEQDSCVLFSLTDVQLSVGDTSCTSITVSNFENLLSFQFSLQYDDTVLEFVECLTTDAISSFRCGDIALQSDGPVFKTLWFEPVGNLVTLEDETTLAQLCFNVIAEPTDGQVLFQFTDDLAPEATKGDPNDLSVAVKFPFCAQEDITSNVYEIDHHSPLTIFPNPAQHVLIIHNTDDNMITEQISIYDISGKLVLIEKQVNSGQQLHIDQLGQGHYFIRIDMNNNSSYTSSFYKE